jgi:hypothetical protein
MKTSAHVKKPLIISALAVALLVILTNNSSIPLHAHLGPVSLTIDGCSGCPDEGASSGPYQSSFVGTVTSEAGYGWESTYTTATSASNEFAAILSSDKYPYTVLGGSSNTEGWEQFIYATNANTAYIWIQDWLLFYGSSCPSGWSLQSGSTNCYRNLGTTSVSVISPGSLSGISITGSASSSGDFVKLCVGSSCTSSTTVTDYIQLYNYWDLGVFNIYGNAGVSGNAPMAVFNLGTSLKITVTAPSGSSLSCSALTGFLTEGNDLYLNPSNPCSHSGNTITFTEGNTPSASLVGTHYCTSATSCQIAGTVDYGDLLVLAIQIPAGTISVSDSVVSLCTGVSPECAPWTLLVQDTLNGEDVDIVYGFLAYGGGSDTITVSTTGGAGTIAIEAIEAQAGDAYTLSLPISASGSYSNGSPTGCSSGTATFMCTNSVSVQARPDIAVASFYAYPSSGMTAGSGWTPAIGTTSNLRAAEYASYVYGSINFPATNSQSATGWADVGGVFWG